MFVLFYLNGHAQKSIEIGVAEIFLNCSILFVGIALCDFRLKIAIKNIAIKQ